MTEPTTPQSGAAEKAGVSLDEAAFAAAKNDFEAKFTAHVPHEQALSGAIGGLSDDARKALLATGDHADVNAYMDHVRGLDAEGLTAHKAALQDLKVGEKAVFAEKELTAMHGHVDAFNKSGQEMQQAMGKVVEHDLGKSAGLTSEKLLEGARRAHMNQAAPVLGKFTKMVTSRPGASMAAAAAAGGLAAYVLASRGSSDQQSAGRGA